MTVTETAILAAFKAGNSISQIARGLGAVEGKR